MTPMVGQVTLGSTEHADFYGYNAESYNPNTGLEYLRARYYNANQGRFFQEDTYLGDISDPLTLNRYAYTKNSPMNYVDPSGHMSEKKLAVYLDMYLRGLISSEDLALLVISENGLGGIWTAFHEIAQLNTAKRLKEKGYIPQLEIHVDRANAITSSNRTLCYEADIVATKIPSGQLYVWEVKPITWFFNNYKMKKAWEKFQDMLTSGQYATLVPGPLGAVGLIEDIPVIGKIKMMILENPNFPGFVYYVMYWKNADNEYVWITNAEARKEVERRYKVSEAIVDYVFALGSSYGLSSGVFVSAGFLDEFGEEAANILSGLAFPN